VTAAANAAATRTVQPASATPPPPPPPSPPPPKKIDIGVVAALGVAFGAITTAFGFFLGFFKGMPIWQFPLVIIGAMLLISLPAVIIAFLKLRQRTVGPILDANGWAINGRVKINIPFGTTLTQRATLPLGSHLARQDPYEDKEAARRRRLIVTLIVLLAAGYLTLCYYQPRAAAHWQGWNWKPWAKITPAAPETALSAPAVTSPAVPAK
ncbi:MAG: hypothetical protein ABIO94_03590, partial [Opitutaceae bacterium]